jgi:hypothetical protein
MIFKKEESHTIPLSHCNKTENGYEFINDSSDIMYVLTRNMSTMNGQMDVYYISKTYVREGDGWIESSNVESYNSIDEFAEKLERAVGFIRAVDDYRNIE